LAQRPIVRKSTMARVQFIVNPRNLKSHILSASFGLSVHGISAYELMASGIPTVVYSPYGEKDHDAMTKIEELGVAEIAQTPEGAVGVLKNLISNKERSAQLSARAADTFHVRGEYTLHSEIRRILDRRA
jgi:UDP-N-acetylglucosamine:LPS N-acetylglucosamine transferase